MVSPAATVVRTIRRSNNIPFHPEDCVAVTSSTPGTGNLTIDAVPPTFYRTLAVAGYATNDTFDARIVAPDNSGWEVSLCKLVDATHIARLKVYINSLGTTAFINFNGTKKTIFVDLPAARIKVMHSWSFTDGTYF